MNQRGFTSTHGRVNPGCAWGSKRGLFSARHSGQAKSSQAGPGRGRAGQRLRRRLQAAHGGWLSAAVELTWTASRSASEAFLRRSPPQREEPEAGDSAGERAGEREGARGAGSSAIAREDMVPARHRHPAARAAARPPPLPWEPGGATSRRRGPGPRRSRVCRPARRAGPAPPAGTPRGAAGSADPAVPWRPTGCREPVPPCAAGPPPACRPQSCPSCRILALRLYTSAEAPAFGNPFRPTRNDSSWPVTKRCFREKIISPPLCRAEAGLSLLAGKLEERGRLNRDS